MTESEEVCALCLKEKPLRDSHIIPKFVGKWLKEEGTGFLVNASDGSKRVQDLGTEKLLCEDCEQKFSKLENSFASNIFYPFHKDKTREFDYDENLKPLIISIAWRGLQIIKEGYLKKESGSPLNSFVIQADKDWREFLNGEGTSIDQYETHMIFLDYLKPDSTTEVDPKFHWYLLHSTDFTICTGDKRVFFYVQLPWIALIISIEPKKLDGWDGTIINKNGCITMGQTIEDGWFFGFLQDRAKLALYSSEGPSEEVSTNRLVKAIEKDPEKYLKSNIFESWIIERDIVRKKKMEKMPSTLIDLVEIAIIQGSSGAGTSLVDSRFNKLKTRRIADRIADLSEEDAKRLDDLIDSVTRMSAILNENKQDTFTSDSVHITFMISLERSPESRVKSVDKEFNRMLKETGGEIHFAIFSYSPGYDNYTSGCFVPRAEFSKKREEEDKE